MEYEVVKTMMVQLTASELDKVANERLNFEVNDVGKVILDTDVLTENYEDITVWFERMIAEIEGKLLKEYCQNLSDMEYLWFYV